MQQDVIIRPLITEQATKKAEKGKFTFHVEIGANKTAIKKAIEKSFLVHVTDVATIIVKGRTKRTGMRRTEKKLSPWKKAVVTLKKDEKIDLFHVGVDK
ncbi:MAG: 50S ribosomal protein L23 [Candidatus Levybacteria bacterium]|nr:50S ribosomal protein L23 [Candidatus Levybacteria bacterium]